VKAWTDTEASDHTSRLEADYVVGYDGASRFVRRAILGEKALSGFAWDDQLVAVDVSQAARATRTKCAC
jgi:2-polyprenyl-6-methoxyphenol hydroxylase-like FAD-dependent oxidoreductase